MKTKLLLLTIGLLLCANLTAQQSFQLHINQPPRLEVSTLDDLIFSGDPVQLGHENMVTGGAGDYIYLWTPQEGLDDPTDARPFATPSGDITYTLVVTDKNGCTGTLSQTVNLDFTGTNNPISLPEVNVFPVPASREVNVAVSWHTNMTTMEMKVFYITGQLAFKEEFKDLTREFYTSLNLMELSAGAYILVITTPEFTVKRNILLY